MDKRNVSLSLIALAFIAATSSCVNSIKQEQEEGGEGKQPILFTTQIVPNPSRTTDDGFKEGEEIGLFATVSSNTLADKRYLDNLELKCGKTGELTPSNVVYYPEGNEALNFVAYYPYQSAGMSEGSDNLTVSVSANQSNSKNHELSDFLIADTLGVHGSSNAVQLRFYHKFSKFKMVLLPEDKGSAKELQADNPKLTLSAIKTQVEYDMQQEALGNLSQPEDIKPYGEWKVEGDSLTGEEFIVIPQTLGTDNFFTLEWNGRLYTCTMPNIDMKGGTQYEIRIRMKDAEPPLLSGILGKVEHWKDGLPNEVVDGENGTTSVRLSSLSFDKSAVYRIYNGAYPVASICKEYLLSNVIKSRAIVAYPTIDGETDDLNNGIVLQLLDTTGIKVGGRLQWDTKQNTFIYTAGDREQITNCYIDDKDNISLDRPTSPAKISVVSYLVQDARSKDIQAYPVVKIGTQYWMQENLRATAYANGESIAKQTTLNGTAGYYHAEGTNDYFYNGEALHDNIATKGWRVPSTADWKELQTYIGNDGTLLRSGEWLASDKASPVTQDGATGFHAYPVGQWTENKVDFKTKTVGFWALDKSVIPATIPTLVYSHTEIVFDDSKSSSSKGKYYKGQSVRLIKE
jgi:uncharacterized protein (TIGR02145 family)